MPRKSRTTQRLQDGPSLPPKQTVELLRGQREKGKKLLANRPITSAADQAWETVTRDVLMRAFGAGSPNVSSVMDVGKYRFAFGGGNEQQWEEGRAEDMETRLEIIDGLIELLDSNAALTKTGAVATPLDQDETIQHGNRVFLVHGRNEATLYETARLLERFGLDVTILREQPNSGRTIIEKFMDYSHVAFAVVLLTGDDRGGLIGAPYEALNPRARQNVILELGFFLGKLGRRRVCALYQEGVEIPSDYSGVLFVALDTGGAWRLALARELKAAGLDIDMNKAV
jgi:predicted nucleotide-binding protein